jgi:hypothetical protein
VQLVGLPAAVAESNAAVVRGVRTLCDADVAVFFDGVGRDLALLGQTLGRFQVLIIRT